MLFNLKINHLLKELLHELVKCFYLKVMYYNLIKVVIIITNFVILKD